MAHTLSSPFFINVRLLGLPITCLIRFRFSVIKRSIECRKSCSQDQVAKEVTIAFDLVVLLQALVRE